MRALKNFAAYLAVLAVLLFAAAPLIAQYNNSDQDEYQILAARYGTSEHNIDVTQRLKELARADRVFRVGNSTFGVDPDHGVRKSLRIYARGRNGRVRMFEYLEGGTVDGAMFTGWGGGDWANERWEGGWDYRDADGDRDRGEYQILAARYGTANHSIDVTRRLQELARQDRVFRMGNSTFNDDPDPGRLKTLRIYARGANGQTRSFDYTEGSTVDGAMFTGWGGGNWGSEGWNGAWEVNDNRGRDDDRRRDEDRGRNAGRLRIENAVYGDRDGDRSRATDVTEHLRSLVRDGRLDIQVSNSTIGFDPAPHSHKVLWVTYFMDGRQQEARAAEGERLRLP